MKILLLEDDVLLQEILVEFLIEEGFSVIACESVNAFHSLSYEQNFDLFLLDVMVKDGNGFQMLQEIRQNDKSTPAIFITALSQISDIEKGFLSGCDDYLKKPFELKELLLRIKAILKRRYKNTLIDFCNGYCYEVESEIIYYHNKIHKIATKERELLKLLLQNEGNFVSIEKITKALWGYENEPSEQSLRVYIKDLRQIVGKENIQTRRNEGYCYKRIV